MTEQLQEEKVTECKEVFDLFDKDKEENTITEEIPLETNENKNIIKKDENNKELENVSNNNEKKQEVIITKYSSLSPDLFSLSYISEFKCFLCGLIPNPENSKEIICCELLLCEECIKKIIDEKLWRIFRTNNCTSKFK